MLERRPPGPGPAGVVHVVHLGPAQGIQTAESVQGLQVLVDGVGDLVLRQELADGAALTLGARPVVAEDVEDQGVVTDAEPLQLIDHATELGIDVLDETAEDLHQAPLEGALRLRDAVPGDHGLGPRRELGIRRDPAQGLLPLEGALAQPIPAIVELPLVLVRPGLGDVMRPVCGARGPVHEEGLVRGEGAVPAHPGDGLLRHVLGEVVGLVVGRLDGVEVLHQPRLPLGCLPGQEAVEVVEADPLAGGPEGKGAHGRGLGGGGVVPLAEGGGLVAVFPQHLGQGRGRARDHARVAIPVHRTLGDGPRAYPLVVAPGQQGGPGRRADRRGVEGVVADPLARDARQRRGMDGPTVGVRQAEAHVVEQDDEDVRGIRGKPVRLHPTLVFGLLQGRPRQARRGGRREGQDRAVVRDRFGTRGEAGAEAGPQGERQGEAM